MVIPPEQVPCIHCQISPLPNEPIWGDEKGKIKQVVSYSSTINVSVNNGIAKNVQHFVRNDR